MRCKKIRILLSAFLDGEISPRDKLLLESHITKCKHCQIKFQELSRYSALAERMETKAAPESLKENVWFALKKGDRKNSRSLNADRQSVSKIWFRSAVAVGIILISITIIPDDLYRAPKVESSFIEEVKKGGKGPAREKKDTLAKTGSKVLAENVHAEQLMRVAADCDATIKEISCLGTSERISHIRFDIPKKQFEKFRDFYNSVQNANPIPEIHIRKWNSKVRLIIGFPTRTFVTGDFNGDGYTDMATHVTGGLQSGKWFVSPNDQSGNFLESFEVRFSDTLKLLPKTSRILAGDFNGDEFDDLFLWISPIDKSASGLIYSNDKRSGFRKAELFEINVPPDIEKSFCQVLAGDLNGDGLDDLLLSGRNKEKATVWMAAINEGEGQFSSFNNLPTGHQGWDEIIKYTSFAIDLNGDGLIDTGIYGQSGERDAWWYVSVNKGKGSFDKENSLVFGNSPRAYQGNYSFFTGDLNGDGYTDLLVKFGQAEDYSEWTKLINKKNRGFTLGQPLKFGIEEDLSIRK